MRIVLKFLGGKLLGKNPRLIVGNRFINRTLYPDSIYNDMYNEFYGVDPATISHEQGRDSEVNVAHLPNKVDLIQKINYNSGWMPNDTIITRVARGYNELGVPTHVIQNLAGVIHSDNYNDPRWNTQVDYAAPIWYLPRVRNGIPLYQTKMSFDAEQEAKQEELNRLLRSKRK